VPLTWQALGEAANPVSGNCGPADNDWCSTQRVRDDAIRLVDNPDPTRGPPKMFRYEVRYQDGQFKNSQGITYSDQRAMTGPPPRLWVSPGTEQWWRWFHLVPQDWIGAFPKQDQLADFPRVKLDGGSGFQFHHAYADNRIETGSAPLYTGIDDNGPWLKLVDQATSTERKRWTYQPLRRLHAYEWLLHILHSPDPNVGFLELWIDGDMIASRYQTQTMYPGTLQYPIAGIYRRFSIGDPSLVWPPRTLLAGNPVYTDGDGMRQAQYLGGFVTGPTRDYVMSKYPTVRGGNSVATTPTAPTVDATKALAGLDAMVRARTTLDAVLLDIDADIAALQLHRAKIAVARDALAAALDKGKWTV
jgi:hypothetical protein